MIAPVRALGSIGVASANLDGWRTLATDIFGATVIDVADGLDIRLDGRARRIHLREAGSEAVELIGWDVADATALDHVATALRAESLDVTGASDDELADRRVEAMVWCVDPTGQRMEFSHGAPDDVEPPVDGFVADELGLGHLVVQAADAPRALRLYQDGLGFRLRDHLGTSLWFLGCNRRHHSLGVADVGGPPRVLHVMIEATEMERIGVGFDRSLDLGLDTSLLGLHTNDRMTSFYVRTPSGFEIEFGWNGLLVDDATWQTTAISRPSVWGHRQVDPAHPPQLRPFHRKSLEGLRDDT